MRSQQMAQRAYTCVEPRVAETEKVRKEYRSFAREFPTLVHQCGLAQAVAFARAKGGNQEVYANDLAKVLNAAGHNKITDLATLDGEARSLSLAQYIRLSRDAITAAIWLKRYVEGLFPDSSTMQGDCQ